MFIQRDYNRTERDDWTINVQPHIGIGYGSVQVYDEPGEVVGWSIEPIYE